MTRNFSREGRILTVFVVLSLIFTLTGIVQVARAASVAGSYFDWSTFYCFGVDIGHGVPTVTFFSHEQYAGAGANGVWNDDYSDDWGYLNVVATDGGAYAEAGYDPGSDFLGSYSEAAADPGDPASDSWSYAERYGDFSVSVEGGGEGLVVFMVDYWINTAIDGGPGVLDAWAEADIWMHIEDETGRYSDSGDYIWQSLGEPNVDKTGTLSVALLFDDGASGHFWSDAYTDTSASAVPIPSTLLLLAPGLLCLVGIRRGTAKV